MRSVCLIPGLAPFLAIVGSSSSPSFLGQMCTAAHLSYVPILHEHDPPKFGAINLQPRYREAAPGCASAPHRYAAQVDVEELDGIR